MLSEIPKNTQNVNFSFIFSLVFFVPEKGLQKGFNDLVIYGNPMILLSKKHTSPIRGYKDFSLPGNVF